MQFDVLSAGSQRRGRPCSICRKVVRPGQRGAFNGNSAWHVKCLAEFVDHALARFDARDKRRGSKDPYLADFVDETSEERRAKSKAEVDKQFEEFRQRLLKEDRDG